MRKVVICWAGLLACSSTPPPESAPAPAAEAAPAPATKAKVETEAEAAPAPEVEPTPDPPAESAAATATATTPLTKKRALAASRTALPGKLAQLAPIVPLPDGRAAVVWRHSNGEHAFEADVVLVVLQRDGGTWGVQGSAVVLEASTPWLDEDAAPPLAVTTKTDDYDDDGEPEVLVRVRHPVMCPGGGPNTITSMDVFDLAPDVAEALSTELHHFMDAYPDEGTKATVKHVDLDDDGHRDVEIAYATKGEKTRVNRWYYDAKADAWMLRKPKYTRWGCDW